MYLFNKDQLRQQLEVMFDEEDFVFHYNKKEINNFFQRDSVPNEPNMLLCLNAIDGAKDLNPWREFHHPDKPRRCDDNVVKYRNFLIECDDVEGIDAQFSVIRKYRIPYSLAVWSGNKSVHFIICLEEPITAGRWRAIINAMLPSDRERAYFKRTKQWLGIEEADVNCKNPSRGVRAAGIIRDNGEKQELLENNGRIPLKSLINKFLIQTPEPIKEFIGEASDEWRLQKYNEKLQELNQTAKGGRHLTMAALVYFASKNGISKEKCLADIKAVCSLPHSEIENTINATPF